MRTLRQIVADVAGEAVVGERRLGGGDTAAAFAFDLTSGRRLFAKTHADPPPWFFTTEAAGLAWLAEPAVVAVPEVRAASDGDADTPAHRVLEWIDEGGRSTASTATTEADLGRALAALHRATPETFGRADRRPTGSRGLPNDPCDSWAEFYAIRRLAPLARLARDGGALGPSALADLERLDADRLREVGGPDEPPARLHGDLWAGNRLVDRHGTSWLIDPAAHGGHREFDLAMMRLFGGFGPACFDAYQDEAPLADGWRDRVALHQIAPLVVHAVKFGGGYRAAATDAISTYA